MELIQNCPWVYVKLYVILDPDVDGLRQNQFIYDVVYDFYLNLINILEYANEVISYTTTR